LLCTHLIPVDLRKQLRTNRGASDQEKSGSQDIRNPERKAEPIVIRGFQISFLVFRFDFITVPQVGCRIWWSARAQEIALDAGETDVSSPSA